MTRADYVGYKDVAGIGSNTCVFETYLVKGVHYANIGGELRLLHTDEGGKLFVRSGEKSGLTLPANVDRSITLTRR